MPQALRVDFWDVGQGDCSVVTLPDGSLFIIDTGPPESPLIDWLSDRSTRGDLRIHAVLLTHNDDDHAGCFEDLLRRFASRIDWVWLQLDRSGHDSRWKELWRSARDHQSKGYGLCNLQTRPENGDIVPLAAFPGDPQVTLYGVFPDFEAFGDNQTKKQSSPNAVSAIVCLDIAGKTEVIWAGDAPMKIVSERCAGRSPRVMVGPHHGAPHGRPDGDRVTKAYRKQFQTPDPSTVFVSVGTGNIYKHPSSSQFIDLHVAKGRRICCSELKHCDAARITARRHVMHHHRLLGLLPPYGADAVTCRGPMRLELTGDGVLVFDPYHEAHREAVKTLAGPLCAP